MPDDRIDGSPKHGAGDVVSEGAPGHATAVQKIGWLHPWLKMTRLEKKFLFRLSGIAQAANASNQAQGKSRCGWAECADLPQSNRGTPRTPSSLSTWPECFGACEELVSYTKPSGRTTRRGQYSNPITVSSLTQGRRWMDWRSTMTILITNMMACIVVGHIGRGLGDQRFIRSDRLGSHGGNVKQRTLNDLPRKGGDCMDGTTLGF